MTRIGAVELPGRVAAAPMAGVTDAAFRAELIRQGAALTFTEMASARALVFQDAKTRVIIEPAPNEKLFAVQLFGSEPEIMAEAAVKAVKLTGCTFIDINMGCPTGKIVRNGEGCALMRDPDLACAIVREAAAAVSVPVTVKMRRGWDKGSLNAPELAAALEKAGAAAFTVHGRTRAQLYSGRSDPNSIRDVKRAVSVPVIANGDVFSGEDAVRLLEYTGADMVMPARGLMGDPWLIARVCAAVEGRPEPPLPPLSERVDTAMRQFRAAAEQKSERSACLEARKHYAWYLRGVSHAGYFKEKIARAETLADLEAITEGIKRELR